MSILEVASIDFSPWQKNGTRKMANGNIPHIGLTMALSSQAEDTRGHTLFQAGSCPLFKLPLTFDNGWTQPVCEH